MDTERMNPLYWTVCNDVSLHNILRSCPFDLAMAIGLFLLYESEDEYANADAVYFYCHSVIDSISMGIGAKHYEKWFRNNFFILCEYFDHTLLPFYFDKDISEFIQSIMNKTIELSKDRPTEYFDENL